MFDAHIFRVGVTNAADRGLDMWANFGPAVQVKHLTLDSESVREIVDQVESDHIVVVCRDADEEVIRTINRQIGWGRRVRGIIRESMLVDWYDWCMRGKFSKDLAWPLLRMLMGGFRAEFPQVSTIDDFLADRVYMKGTLDCDWSLDSNSSLP